MEWPSGLGRAAAKASSRVRCPPPQKKISVAIMRHSHTLASNDAFVLVLIHVPLYCHDAFFFFLLSSFFVPSRSGCGCADTKDNYNQVYLLDTSTTPPRITTGSDKMGKRCLVLGSMGNVRTHAAQMFAHAHAGTIFF